MSRSLTYALIILLLGAVVFLGVKTYQLSSVESSEIQAEQGSGGDSKNLKKRKSPTPYLIRQLVDPSKHLEEQIEAVRALPSDLSAQEYQALADLFNQAPPLNVTAERWHVLINEIMEVLRQSRFKWDGYTEAMSALMTDRHVDPIIRDYAAQHLALYLGTERIDKEQFQQGMKAFLTVLQGQRESHELVMGTSLMALCELSANRSKDDFAPYRRDLGQIIKGYVSGERPTTMANRIAAIQSAGRMNFPEIRPLIRDYAAQEIVRHHSSRDAGSVKLSSIAALGYYADPSDQDFLQKLSQSDSKFRFAAQTALKQFSSNQE